MCVIANTVFTVTVQLYKTLHTLDRTAVDVNKDECAFPFSCHVPDRRSAPVRSFAPSERCRPVRDISMDV